MLPYREHRLGTFALIVFFVLLVSYVAYEFYSVALGPRIAILDRTLVVHDAFTTIRGSAENIAELQMNGRTIFVTEAGAFEEPHLLNPGTNTVVLDARDNYGRTRREVMEVVYQPAESPSATSR